MTCTLYSLGQAALEAGESLARARASFVENLLLFRELEGAVGIAYCLAGLGEVAAALSAACTYPAPRPRPYRSRSIPYPDGRPVPGYQMQVLPDQVTEDLFLPVPSAGNSGQRQAHPGPPDAGAWCAVTRPPATA